MSRSARDRLTDIQTAIAKVYVYRASLRGDHSDMAVSAILREIGIIGEAVNLTALWTDRDPVPNSKRNTRTAKENRLLHLWPGFFSLPVSHHCSKRYPIPDSVTRCRGLEGLSSSLRRS